MRLNPQGRWWYNRRVLHVKKLFMKECRCVCPTGMHKYLTAKLAIEQRGPQSVRRDFPIWINPNRVYGVSDLIR